MAPLIMRRPSASILISAVVGERSLLPALAPLFALGTSMLFLYDYLFSGDFREFPMGNLCLPNEKVVTFAPPPFFLLFLKMCEAQYRYYCYHCVSYLGATVAFVVPKKTKLANE